MKSISVEEITALMPKDKDGKVIDRMLHYELMMLVQNLDIKVQKEIDLALVDHFVEFLDWIGSADRYGFRRCKNSHINTTQVYEDLMFFKIATSPGKFSTQYTPIDRIELYNIFKQEKGIK